MSVSLILGGIKSGKTKRALDLAKSKNSALPKYFVATNDFYDDEMNAKIQAHRIERGQDFITIEANLDIITPLLALPKSVIVIDEIASWVNNILHYSHEISDYMPKFLQFLQTTDHEIIIISQEMSFAPVSEHALTRKFVNILGECNQNLAKIANFRELMVAGMAIRL